MEHGFQPVIVSSDVPTPKVHFHLAVTSLETKVPAVILESGNLHYEDHPTGLTIQRQQGIHGAVPGIARGRNFKLNTCNTCSINKSLTLDLTLLMP